MHRIADVQMMTTCKPTGSMQDTASSLSLCLMKSASHSLFTLPVVPYGGQQAMLSLKHLALTRELVVFH